MTTGEYIDNVLTRDKLAICVRAGIVSLQVLTHYDIAKWHEKHGRNRERTAAQFKVSRGLVGYAVTRMNQQVNV